MGFERINDDNDKTKLPAIIGDTELGSDVYIGEIDDGQRPNETEYQYWQRSLKLTTKGTKTGKPLKVFMYNTIRYYISSLKKREGFPVRDYSNVGFYGLLMLSVPANSVIHPEMTYPDRDWETFPFF